MAVYTEMEKEVADILRLAVEESRIAGAAVLLIKEGETVLSVQEGMADRERRQPMREDTIFRLHSMTKPVLAACALRLAEQGRLGLEDALGDYLPEYAQMRIAPPDRAGLETRLTVSGRSDSEMRTAARPIRIYHLLSMTSGLVYPDPETLPGREMGEAMREVTGRLLSDRPFTTREAAARFASCPLAFEPGRGWAYGVSADVLGAVMEKATDLSLADLLRREILDPLEMEDTDFGVPDSKRNRLAAVYEEPGPHADPFVCRGEEKGVSAEVPDRGSGRLVRADLSEMGLAFDAPLRPPFASGGAGLCGTLADYRKFALMLLGGGRAENPAPAFSQAAGLSAAGAGRCKVLNPQSAAFLAESSLTRAQQPFFDRAVMFSLGRYTYGGMLRKCLRADVSPRVARCGEYGWGGQDGTDFVVFPAEKAVLLIGMQKRNARMYSLGKKIRGAVLKYL